MNKSIISSGSLEFRLPVKSPFIITAHHLDYYPEGNSDMGPKEYLKNQNIGDDFNLKAPWRMYYGDTIPGFPVHPHRGFETVTIVEQGFVDHTDSLGGTGRYGEGDVQWLTTGAGIQHCEMFPLLNEDKANTMELFQIWLNLPSKSKMNKPHYKMLWKEDIPVISEIDSKGNTTKVKLISGKYKDSEALSPPPDSWAFDKENNVNIWIIDMESEAEFTLRETSETAGRMVYFYEGENLYIDDEFLESKSYAELVPNMSITFKNGKSPSKILLLEGEPINEPVAAMGPFVMNTKEEIIQASRDYRETEFGGWPWNIGGPVNPIDSGRFAKFSDGTIEYPNK